jgi:hypothetical protein
MVHRRRATAAMQSRRSGICDWEDVRVLEGVFRKPSAIPSTQEPDFHGFLQCCFRVSLYWRAAACVHGRAGIPNFILFDESKPGAAILSRRSSAVPAAARLLLSSVASRLGRAPRKCRRCRRTLVSTKAAMTRTGGRQSSSRPTLGARDPLLCSAHRRSHRLYWLTRWVASIANVHASIRHSARLVGAAFPSCACSPD